jgi:hypothetical protein
MSNTFAIQQRDYGQSLNISPFVVFTILLMTRSSESYGQIFNVIPVLGRTIPYFAYPYFWFVFTSIDEGTLRSLACVGKN